MTLGMAPLAVTLLLLGQAPIRGDKEFEVPIAFSKKDPEFEDLKAIEKHVRELTKKLMPVTVGIRIGGSSGSGVIIDGEGHVLTAAHVSGDPGRPCEVILLDGRKLKGKTLGANRTIDSGMILITDKAEFKHAEMSKSASLKSGDWCLALGHPGGFQAGRTPPLRLGRILNNNPGLSLQTNCTLVGGDSGGPLFDMTGGVIGIHSRIGDKITANIHVPVDPYRDNFTKLAKAEVWGNNVFGGFSAAYLGAMMAADPKICKVQAIVPNSPAEKAGLKVDDLILKLDGQQVASADAFAKIMKSKSPGNEVVIEIRRGEEVLHVQVALVKAPKG